MHHAERLAVLYVEDEPNIAKLLASGLSLFGIEVLPALMSAEELLDRRNATPFQAANILIIDMRLPKMTGLELATELRRRGENRPIVLVSAWPAPPKEKLQELQATFLPKPFDFPDVVKTIQQLAFKNADQ